MFVKIGNRLFHAFNVFLKQANAGVAPVAQKAAHLAGGVAVIYSKLLAYSSPFARMRVLSTANCASTALKFYQVAVLRNRYAVFFFQNAFTRILWMFSEITSGGLSSEFLAFWGLPPFLNLISIVSVPRGPILVDSFSLASLNSSLVFLIIGCPLDTDRRFVSSIISFCPISTFFFVHLPVQFTGYRYLLFVLLVILFCHGAIIVK